MKYGAILYKPKAFLSIKVKTTLKPMPLSVSMEGGKVQNMDKTQSLQFGTKFHLLTFILSFLIPNISYL